MPLDRTKVDRMIAKMDAWLTQREQEQAAGICDNEDDLAEGHTFPVAPSAPFADSPPEKIHGEGREDQVASPWGEKPKVPIPIEHI